MAQNNIWRMLFTFLLLLLIINAAVCFEAYDIRTDNSGLWVIDPAGNVLRCDVYGCQRIAYLPKVINNSTCILRRCTGF